MTVFDRLISTVPLPDILYRLGIRAQLRARLKAVSNHYETHTIQDYANDLSASPIAIQTDKANDQHYEVPASFFDIVLGKHKKYSSCLYNKGTLSLDVAEDEMLALTCERAELKNGQDILELGCGWGSLSLYMARRYPDATITVVSNSHSQKIYIDQCAQQEGLTNLTVITTNVAVLELSGSFDRIVSIEMLEHIRNYQAMFSKIRRWLKEDGKLFVHIFGHHKWAYVFDDDETSSWMARHFFSGGQMPSQDLFSHFNHDLSVEKDWVVSGIHYAKTCREWLNNMDAHKSDIMAIFHDVYGEKASIFWIYWRLFFMACEELFAFNEGNEWQVYHYLLTPNID